MAVTRDPNFPPEIAQLMQAFNMAADGHSAEVVLNASLQMVICSIGFISKQRGVGLSGAQTYVRKTVVELIQTGVAENWNREAKASDVQVKAS